MTQLVSILKAGHTVIFPSSCQAAGQAEETLQPLLTASCYMSPLASLACCIPFKNKAWWLWGTLVRCHLCSSSAVDRPSIVGVADLAAMLAFAMLCQSQQSIRDCAPSQAIFKSC